MFVLISVVQNAIRVPIVIRHCTVCDAKVETTTIFTRLNWNFIHVEVRQNFLFYTFVRLEVVPLREF